jgi:hypothetical protein
VVLPREVLVVIISAEQRIGPALSGLPFVYHIARAEAGVGRRVFLLIRNKEVADLIPPSERARITFVDDVEDLWAIEPPLSEQRIAHLDADLCLRRFGRRCHIMEAHFVNHGVYPDRWEPPRLEIPEPETAQSFDIVVSPSSLPRDGDRWPLKRWQELVDRLRPRYSIGAFGPPVGGDGLDGVMHLDSLTLAQVCSVLTQAKVAVLSEDNDVSHLAHALRVPHFLLYSEAVPPRWGENTNENGYRVVANLRDLSVEQAWRGLEPLLLLGDAAKAD